MEQRLREDTQRVGVPPSNSVEQGWELKRTYTCTHPYNFDSLHACMKMLIYYIRNAHIRSVVKRRGVGEWEGVGAHGRRVCFFSPTSRACVDVNFERRHDP